MRKKYIKIFSSEKVRSWLPKFRRGGTVTDNEDWRDWSVTDKDSFDSMFNTEERQEQLDFIDWTWKQQN